MWQVKNQTTFTSGAADLLFNCISVQICSKIELFFFLILSFYRVLLYVCLFNISTHYISSVCKISFCIIYILDISLHNDLSISCKTLGEMRLYILQQVCMLVSPELSPISSCARCYWFTWPHKSFEGFFIFETYVPLFSSEFCCKCFNE